VIRYLLWSFISKNKAFYEIKLHKIAFICVLIIINVI